MLGKEYCSILLSSPSAILQWPSRANGWYAQDDSPQNAQTRKSRERMVVLRLSICRSHDARKNTGKRMDIPSIGQLVGIWKSHDKAQAKSLDDRGSVGYLLDIDIWQSGSTRIMQDGVVVKGLAPKRLDPCRYQLTAGPTLDDLEKNMPWRSIQDEFGKFKRLDHTGKIYQGDSVLRGARYYFQADVRCQHDAFL